LEILALGHAWVDRVLRNPMGKRIAAPPPIFSHRLRRRRSTRALCFPSIYQDVIGSGGKVRGAPGTPLTI